MVAASASVRRICGIVTMMNDSGHQCSLQPAELNNRCLQCSDVAARRAALRQHSPKVRHSQHCRHEYFGHSQSWVLTQLQLNPEVLRFA